MTENENTLIKLGLPKGRMKNGVFSLLTEAGIRINETSRAYRPEVSLPGFEVKILKPQDIIYMLNLGSRDVGFAGADWVEELQSDVVELLDTGLDPVRLVAAAPDDLLEDGALPKKPLVVASEYARLTESWIKRSGLDATFVRSYGATEVFPPEDADCIVDNAASGATLRANNLKIVDELMKSSTRLYANKKAMENPLKRDSIEKLVLLVRSVLDARTRVMLEVNVSGDDLEAVVEVIPCLKRPTISSLHGEGGYVLKAAVPRVELPLVIPKIKERGGTDIVVTRISQLIS